MADLAASAVTILDHWPEGGITGKRRTALKFQATLSTQGAGTTGAKIPATAFGLKTIEECSVFVGDGGDIMYVATPSYDNTEIVLKAAATNATASFSDTVRGVVKGQTLNALGQ